VLADAFSRLPLIERQHAVTQAILTHSFGYD
jgi:hypothetical protein